MTNPSPYVVSYNFGGYQANNPATPLPGGKVDIELANVATAIAQLVAFVENVIRSDGALQNNVVTFDSLAQGLQLLTDPTNGNLVAAAVAGAQASASSASTSAATATAQAVIATAQAVAAANSAAAVNLSLYLAKANNLAGLGNLVTSRQNLGLGSAAVLTAGAAANNAVQLDGSAKLPALDGSQLINIDTLPIGTTIWLNGLTVPAGFLPEDGALLSRATFPRLWTFASFSSNVVAEATWLAGAWSGFSSGDLSTTFRAPDSRGEFFRAYDNGRGVDAGRFLYNHQADTFKDHTHSYNSAATTGNTAAPASGHAFLDTNGAATSGAASTGAGSETRPRNNAKLACIKAY